MKTDDWSAAASELLAERRSAFADRVPELETLQAFFRDELPEDEADLVREFLVLYPEVAQAFAADESTPPVPGPGHPAHLSAAEREAGWRDLAERLEIEDERAIGAVPSRRPPGFAPRWHTAWAIAASLAFFGVLTSALRPGEPRIHDAQTVELEQTRGSAAAPWPVTLHSGDDEVLLQFPLAQTDALERYRVELRVEQNGGTKTLWQKSDVPPGEGDTITLSVPKALIPPGTYQLYVEIDDSSTDTRQWTYRFETR